MVKKTLESKKQGWAGRAWQQAKGAALAGRLAVAKGDKARVAGEALREQLDGMKGMAMKLGQIVSYLDVPLPDEAQRALEALQTGVVAMDWETTRALLETRLGSPLERHFSSIEPQPVAAASIGQVHRARLTDGDPVAVKVLYPHIRESFEADTRRLHRIAGLASLASAVDGHGIVGELGARLEEECDYVREARVQRRFREAWHRDGDVVIPRVIDGASAEGVLTTGWLDGRTLTQLIEQSSPAERDAAAMTLMQFTYRSLLTLAAIQADPHPGNQLFLGGARVGFLDFGCVRVFDAAFITDVRALMSALIDGRRSDFDALVVELGFAPRPDRFDFDHHWEAERCAFTPFLSPVYHFERGFVRRAAAMNGPDSPNARHQALPPPWMWIYRLTFGLHSSLARMGARGRYADMLREILASPVTPLLPDGEIDGEATAGGRRGASFDHARA